jgi:Leucine-rich repeat (LRR) protein
VVGLTCKNNQLTKLDISGNKYLTSLNFSNNQVADVTVAQDQGKFLALDYSGNPLPDETKALLDSLRLLGAATTI